MTEPVAYWHIPQLENDEPFVSFGPSDSNIFESIPLYTSEQLHTRVKMTQKQYKEWQSAIRSIYPVNLYGLFNLIFNATEHHGAYAGMRDIFSFDKGQKKLAQLWSDFDPFNPEETIEIVPTKKWFVRSKELNSENNYYYFVGKRPQDLFIIYGYKKAAKQFDTKEEAEKWKNPLTEAVQLEVDEINTLNC